VSKKLSLLVLGLENRTPRVFLHYVQSTVISEFANVSGKVKISRFGSEAKLIRALTEEKSYTAHNRKENPPFSGYFCRNRSN
jgi:hypothetical protein